MGFFTRRTGGVVVTLVAVGLLAIASVACGGGDDDGSSGSGGPFGGSNGNSNGSGSSGSSAGNKAGSCSVKLTGDVSGDFKGAGGSGSVGTDYWLTDDEIKAALAFLHSNKDELAEALAKDPRIFLLILNCEADKVSLSFLPSNDSKYKDVPFKKAAEYPIPAGGPLGGAAKPGEFNVLVTVDDDPYVVEKAGSLKLTRFDESGIAGTFSFSIGEAFPEGTAKKMQVTGQFEFPCQGGKVCK